MSETQALAAFVAREHTRIPSRAHALLAAARATESALGEEAAAVVAAALAGAELAGAGEARTVAAIAVGCEVAARLRGAMLLDPAWDAAGVVAIVGAAAAAAHVLALDETQARDALGIAATQATGLALARGTTAGAAAHRKAASDALEAAVLARHGFTAAPAAIEGRRGLAALMASTYDTDALVGRLGEDWRFADP